MRRARKLSNIFGICYIVMFCSCATTGSYLKETLTSVDGETVTTELKTKSMVTAWAEQQEGSGSAHYEWGPDGGTLDVGQSAVGQKSNIPIEQMVPLISALAPLLIPPVAPVVESPSFREQVLEYLREHPEILQQRPVPTIER